MLCAGVTNGIFFDRTTNYVIQNLVELDCGGVDILNLFSSVDKTIDSNTDSENLKAIETSAKNADIVVFAVGTGHQANKKVQLCQNAVLDVLNPYNEKLHCIADDYGKKFYHRLCPKVQKWNLVKFDVEELTGRECEDD